MLSGRIPIGILTGERTKIQSIEMQGRLFRPQIQEMVEEGGGSAVLSSLHVVGAARWPPQVGFEDVVAKFGYLLEIDNNTLMRRRVDKARLKVGCRGPEDIPSSMTAVVEELSFILRLEVEKTPKDGGNPSRSTVFKKFFFNLGVAGEGRSGLGLNWNLAMRLVQDWTSSSRKPTLKLWFSSPNRLH